MISIFLSSTFRDMQKERDLIHRYVLPKVQDYAGKYHELVNIVDLRWGIDTGQLNQQTAIDKVLLTCKSMIQECRPCFIALLGAVYGTVLKKEYQKYFTFQQSLSNHECLSVTEFEVCSRLALTEDNICFMLRTDVSQIEERQQLFRNAVETKYQQYTVYYRLNDTPESQTEQNNGLSSATMKFVDAVFCHICQCIDCYVEQNPINTYYENYVRSSAVHLSERVEYTAQLISLLRSDAQLILLSGIAGVGKRTTLYHALAQGSYNIVGITGSAQLKGNNTAAICHYLSEQIEPYLSKPLEKKELHPVKQLEIILEEYSRCSETLLVIVLEQADMLFGTDWVRNIFRLPLSGSASVKWCATVTQNDHSWAIFQNDISVAELPLSFLSAKEKTDIIIAMYRHVGKELSPENVNAICVKKESGYPRYLQTIVSLMLHFDESDLTTMVTPSAQVTMPGDAMTKHFSQYIEALPEKTEEIYGILWKKMSAQVDSGLASILTQCLLLTNYGLRETDLKALVCFAPFHYTEEAFYLTYLYLRQELYLSTEQRYCLKFRSVPKSEHPLVTMEHLTAYLQTLPEDDIVRNTELPLLYLRQGRFENFYRQFLVLCERSLLYRQVLQTIVSHDASLLMKLGQEVCPDNVQQMAWVTELVTKVCFTSMSTKESVVVMKWLRTLIEKYTPETCQNTLPYWFSIYSCAAKYASVHGTSAEQNEYNSQEQRLFSEMKAADVENFQPVYTVLLLNIEIVKNLAQARKCLDEGLPTSLCSHILSKINSMFHQIGHIVKESDFAMISVLVSSQLMDVMGLYHELCGDVKYREGLYQEALDYYQKALSSSAPKLNRYAWTMKCAGSYEKLGNYQEALKQAKQCLVQLYEMEAAGEKMMEVETNIGLTYGRIGGILLALHMYSDAYVHLKKSVQIFETIYQNERSMQSICDYATALFKTAELAADTAEAKECNSIQMAEALQFSKKAELMMMEYISCTGDFQWMENLEICQRLQKKLEGYV